MKKILPAIFVLLLCSSLFLGACSNGTQSKKNTKKTEEQKQQLVVPKEKENYALNQTLDFLGLHVTFTNATYVQDDKGKKDSVLKVDMKVQNNSASRRTFTSIDMKMTDADGKKLAIYPGENIGADIQPQKKITGSAYFHANGNPPYIIKYTDPESDVTAQWKVKDPR
ncbi:DUF4352 domain-containing protein [Listeria aquatica]|uniref:DUF4352 domain-containing protein n=1 Tax=Listeria aquatica TaxID=1494960 RepID=UPI0031F4BCC8